MRFFSLAIFLVFCLSSANAEMRNSDFIIAYKNLPNPTKSANLTVLDVPHLRQAPNLCVPTSSAMILKFYGQPAKPRHLKQLAENHKPKNRRNQTFTYWNDMRHALRSLGQNWKIRNYPKTNSGFARGLKEIKKSLLRGNPVMIDVHLNEGHTIVVMGFDDHRQLVFIRDPNLPRHKSRANPYTALKESWHNHKFGANRSAFFAKK